MSGHSKWAKIKRAKGATDAKKGQLFTKIANQITIAAKEGGGDPDMNFILRMQIDKARIANMPTSGIEKAIDRGTGKNKDGAQIEQITYEAFGPDGVAVLIDCLTDNTNRAVADVRNIVENLGGTFASINSVAWQFEEKGLIIVQSAKIVPSDKFGQDDKIIDANPEETELELFEIEGIESIEEMKVEDEDGNEKDGFGITVIRVEFDKVRKAIEAMNLKIISADMVRIATNEETVSEDKRAKVERFIEALEENDDVQSVWTNVNMNS